MRVAFHTLDVFSHRRFCGNQLAVLPHASRLTTAQMQQVAAEFNLPETVFLCPPESGDAVRTLRIFTPRTELPFAGHPTLGAAHLLVALGDVALENGSATISLDEGSWPVSVRLRQREDGLLFSQLLAPEPTITGPPPPHVATLARVLSLHVGDIRTASPGPVQLGCGVRFLVVPVRDIGALGRAALDLTCWKKEVASGWATNLYVVAPGVGAADFRVRMFAPETGVPEDPASGSAACAMAGYLAARSVGHHHQWIVDQGVEMGRPSRLYLEAEAVGANIEVRVGGTSVHVSAGEIDVGESCTAAR